jgi:hypothetical protein
MQQAAPSEKIPKNKNAKSEKRNRRNKRQAKRVPKNTRHGIVGGIKTSEPSSQYAAPAGVNGSVLEIGGVDAGERPHARSIDATDDAENIAPRSLTMLSFCSSAAIPRSDRRAAAMSRAAAWPLQDLHAPDGAISPRLHEQIALRIAAAARNRPRRFLAAIIIQGAGRLRQRAVFPKVLCDRPTFAAT